MVVRGLRLGFKGQVRIGSRLRLELGEEAGKWLVSVEVLTKILLCACVCVRE